MKTDIPLAAGELWRDDLRLLTARLAHPDDPLAAWKAEFDNWVKAIVDCREFEDERLLRVEEPTEQNLRWHRWLLHRLMSVGEMLALKLWELQGLNEELRKKSLSHVDVFLAELDDRCTSWHREVNPAHRAMIAKFLD
ncbi:MAG: hypothetical protein HYY23_04060 [Verrucomicrobia bacterium]|nr:hypothetical protein [Verrucomicrobiota bacterium]